MEGCRGLCRLTTISLENPNSPVESPGVKMKPGLLFGYFET
jgi:hypothetical protein